MIVDYADRWPLSHLTWLFSNALFHQPGVPTRILMLARTAYAWSAVHAELDRLYADGEDQHLAPLPIGDPAREAMFTAARDAFADVYRLDTPGVVGVPAALGQAEFGLTLTVHMAALVAIDAHHRGVVPPAHAAGLSAYLLQREQHHWSRLYGNNTERLDFATPPSVMGRAVFTAVLTGPVDHTTGGIALTGLGQEVPTERVLSDHGYCYPPSDLTAGTVLEPLYPDRLAEDFLALSLPGHLVTEQPADPWTAAATTFLLRAADPGQAAPVYAARAVVFLAAAAARWPHVGPRYLFPLLRAQPTLALAAGGAALTTVALLPDLDLGVLEAIEPLLPASRHVDLDIAAAAISTRLTEHRLATATKPATRARLHANHAVRLSNAGRRAEALAYSSKAVSLYQELTALNRDAYLSDLATSVNNHAVALAEAGQRAEALAASNEAVTLYRELTALNRDAYLSDLAMSVNNHALRLAETGQRAEALAVSREAVSLFQELVTHNRDAYLSDLATSVNNHAVALAEAGQRAEALTVSNEAVTLRRELAALHRGTHLSGLAAAVSNHATSLAEAGRRAEALAVSSEAVSLFQELVTHNRDAYLSDLAAAVSNHATSLAEAGRRAEALAVSSEAVSLFQELVTVNRDAYLSDLAASVNNHALRLADAGQRAGALAVSTEAVTLYRELAAFHHDAYLPDLAMSVNNHALRLADAGQRAEALTVSTEAVTLHRELTALHHDAYLPDLAMSVHNQAIRLAEAGQPAEALTFAGEAVTLRRELTALNRDAYLSDLAMSVNNHALRLAGAGQRAEALTASTEAVTLYRELTALNRDAYLPDLARCLLAAAWVRLNLNIDLDRGLTLAEQAVLIYLTLTKHEPEAFLSTTGAAFAVQEEILRALGRYDDAKALHDLLKPTQDQD
ncbi:tetratricopeptide repeat protein [Catellatospora tritici]|uniref:tetratricopeptide repeat protein n=1 Tax=Catellatospora tritici TaxID=2851566 RepID=UPI001C2D6459|nr:tetratricopeptide repeat protein [Catellatospora tritici]MBV1851291.1 tetratricopeptide repeat protein [Catellatospora tritici]